MARRLLPQRYERAAAWTGIALLALLLAASIAWGTRAGAPQGATLLYLASRSLLRMVAAFFVSVTFALVYGYSAATSPRAAKILLPVLDVLQSVPILGFFPVAVLFFISLFHGSVVGLELASVFLIFTSQAWNMAFAVYESIATLPAETSDASAVLGVSGWLRVKRVLLPCTVPKLVYNGIFSWAGGWYFVTAAEVISANDKDIVLPGLGSFIFERSEAGDVGGLMLGIGVLISAVLVFELLLWRPLQVFAERFKFDGSRSGAPLKSSTLRFYRFLRGGKRIRLALPSMAPLAARIPAVIRRRPSDRVVRALRLVATWGFAALLLGAVGLLAVATVNALLRPLSSDVVSIPLALLASAARLTVAYLITLAWSVPLAIYIARNEKASRAILPLTEILASVPAAALFPLIIVLVVLPTGGLGLGSIILLMTGMQWYLLFNLIAGARSIPSDLLAAAEVHGVKGWMLWKRVYLPGMMPSLLTGSVTAWGGGWNALIISEYLNFGGAKYHVFGAGYLIDKASFELHDAGLLLLSILAMVLFIYAVNAVFWKPLYRRAITRYRLEG